MVAKVCSRSQAQPRSGSRNRAITSTKLSIGEPAWGGGSLTPSVSISVNQPIAGRHQSPTVRLQDLHRREARLVGHLLAAPYPIAEIQVGEAQSPGFPDV